MLSQQLNPNHAVMVLNTAMEDMELDMEVTEEDMVDTASLVFTQVDITVARRDQLILNP